MSTEIKFCGMTRAEDAREAASLGAAFVGVIFAGGPRNLTVEQAADVLGGLPASVRRVGVFANADDQVADHAARLGLHAVQLHAEYDPGGIGRIRRRFHGEVWSVVRIGDARLPYYAGELFSIVDGVLLDAKVPGQLGGTGVALPWQELIDQIQPLREGSRSRLILAGGLRPENVAEAIRLLRPDVVDVSSGVETEPGVKDRARMRAFRDAVNASS
ncbi:MAG TPA: phosphoribosylanthranilate isomerase [Gemmatimonadaceae bacterium]